ncbi:response regulator [Flavobacterium franklandianum]|nr:response regulator [Flavobacterium franklandianum]TRX29383.1 response regulator [Flavobacterium franklandianum]
MENKTDDLSVALQQMQTNLKKVSEEHTERTWLQTGKNNLNEKLSSVKTLLELSKEIIDFLVSYTSAQIGTVYVFEDDALHLQHSYGINGKITSSFRMGEGLVGQAAVGKSLNILHQLPENYFKIESSLGKEKPDIIAILPAVFNNQTMAVIELGKFGDFSPMQYNLLKEISEPIAISINAVVAKKNLENLVSQLKSKEKELNNQISAINRSSATIEFDLNGIILSVNEIFLNLLGYTENEIVGKHHSLFVEKSHAASKEYRQFWDNLRKGEFQQEEFKRIHKNGESVWFLGSYNPILDESGKPIKILKIATNVTLAKKQQVEIDAITTAIYKSNLIIEFDLNGIILKVNDNFLDIMGYKESEIIGKHHSIFVVKGYETSIEYTEFWNNLKKGMYQMGEFKRISKSGETVWIKGNYNPIFDEQGNTYKILKFSTDVTLVTKQAYNLALQAEELQTQQEELKQMNEELEQMNEELEEQAQNLKQQQEELQMSNEELEEQTQSLEEQTKSLEEKNKEVEASKYDIEQKTKQLEISSKYKSEFLANMSHELRTPLNSLLILSKDLSENRNKNLDEDQVESAEIIYKSGHDLLILINEVLDLSKIEAGKMSVNVERVSLRNFTDELLRNFKHQAEQKGLKLTSKLNAALPESIRTDLQRLNQILKNLLSNAIKFTENGSVNLSIDRYTQSKVIISVTDTGIGIQEDKQMDIFEAFQQADGGTSRKYGGTGLGLSISRELANLLGAEIKLSSKLNEGSTFSIIIPLEIHPEQESLRTNTLEEEVLYKPHSNIHQDENDTKYLNYPSIQDDRDTITKDDKVVLIVEDDLKFASVLLKQANKKGFKCLAAATGEDSLLLATKYKPQAIILDMELPGINGHKVLLELKTNPSIRHIPVHIISANERSLEPIKEGAIEYLMKPVNKNDLEEAFNRIENFISRKMKNLLIIEDNENARKAMRKLIGNGDVKCLEAGTGKDALALYQENKIDCIILDIGLPDMTGFDLIYKLEGLKDQDIPPIIIYTGKELTKEENNELQKYAESIIIKGVKSEERLLDETALFLHRTISNLPESKQMIINNLYDKEAVFHSKKILLVDDDMRNVFALSKILKERGMEIIKAENGKNALEMLDKHADIHMALMDIMMPEMDGYEAIKRIRLQIKHKNLPVIALTAKAMNDDKQKCIEAGANDYIAKPVDVERLLSLMRVWLCK